MSHILILLVFLPRCRHHHHRGHHSAESGSDRDSSYSREERRRNRSVAPGVGGGGILIWKGLGCASENFKRTLKRYQDSVLWAWLEILSPLKRYSFLNNSAFPKKYRKSSRQEIPKTLSWPLEGTTSTTILFVWKSPPRESVAYNTEITSQFVTDKKESVLVIYLSNIQLDDSLVAPLYNIH